MLSVKSEDDVFTKKLITAPQAEKLLGKKDKSIIADLIIKPEGKPTLAPESDKRPAIGDVSDCFDTLDWLIKKPYNYYWTLIHFNDYKALIMICTKCRNDLPETSFSIRSDTGKPRRQCKNCRSKVRKSHYENNKSHELARCKTYYQDNKETYSKRAKIYYQNNKKSF